MDYLICNFVSVYEKGNNNTLKVDRTLHTNIGDRKITHLNVRRKKSQKRKETIIRENGTSEQVERCNISRAIKSVKLEIDKTHFLNE